MKYCIYKILIRINQILNFKSYFIYIIIFLNNKNYIFIN